MNVSWGVTPPSTVVLAAASACAASRPRRERRRKAVRKGEASCGGEARLAGGTPRVCVLSYRPCSTHSSPLIMLARVRGEVAVGVRLGGRPVCLPVRGAQGGRDRALRRRGSEGQWVDAWADHRVGVARVEQPPLTVWGWWVSTDRSTKAEGLGQPRPSGGSDWGGGGGGQRPGSITTRARAASSTRPRWAVVRVWERPW